MIHKKMPLQARWVAPHFPWRKKRPGELLLLHRDGRDFDASIVDQTRRLDGRARWFGIGHEALVNLVHVRKLMNVGEIDCDADDILQFEAGGLQDFLDILERGSGFRPNSAGDQFIGSIGTFLTGDIERVSGNDSVTERKSS